MLTLRSIRLASSMALVTLRLFMKLSLALSALVLIAWSASAAEGPANVLTDAERAAGWKLLFDGTSLRGWRLYAQQAPPGAGWQVQNGILKKLPKVRGGDIITEAKFGDFDLSWEWRLEPGANNGVKYLVTEQRTAG